MEDYDYLTTSPPGQYGGFNIKYLVPSRYVNLDLINKIYLQQKKKTPHLTRGYIINDFAHYRNIVLNQLGNYCTISVFFFFSPWYLFSFSIITNKVTSCVSSNIQTSSFIILLSKFFENRSVSLVLTLYFYRQLSKPSTSALILYEQKILEPLFGLKRK